MSSELVTGLVNFLGCHVHICPQNATINRDVSPGDAGLAGVQTTPSSPLLFGKLIYTHTHTFAERRFLTHSAPSCPIKTQHPLASLSKASLDNEEY